MHTNTLQMVKNNKYKNLKQGETMYNLKVNEQLGAKDAIKIIQSKKDQSKESKETRDIYDLAIAILKASK